MHAYSFGIHLLTQILVIIAQAGIKLITIFSGSLCWEFGYAPMPGLLMKPVAGLLVFPLLFWVILRGFPTAQSIIQDRDLELLSLNCLHLPRAGISAFVFSKLLHMVSDFFPPFLSLTSG